VPTSRPTTTGESDAQECKIELETPMYDALCAFFQQEVEKVPAT
jgi:hypothetical protein